MTKKEFARKLSEKEVFKSIAESERGLDAILEIIEETLVAGEDINFIGWGKFEKVARPERTGRNPKTGEEIKIAAKNSVKFKAGKALVDKMN